MLVYFRDEQAVKHHEPFPLGIGAKSLNLTHVFKEHILYQKQHKPPPTPKRPLLIRLAFPHRGENALRFPASHKWPPLTISRKTMTGPPLCSTWTGISWHLNNGFNLLNAVSIRRLCRYNPSISSGAASVIEVITIT
jgi:hypothetical protein